MELIRQLAVCPACKQGVDWSPDGVSCSGCGHAFAIQDGIPVLAEPPGEGLKGDQAEFFDAEDSEYEIERPNGTPALHAWLLAEKFRRSIAALGDLRDATVLTVCGGSGMDAEMLARRGARVVLSDISVGAVRRAGERSRRHGVPFETVVADVEHLPFADRSFDFVYVHDGLHHLEHPFRGLQEMARVARLGVSVNEPALAAATALAVRAGISADYEEAGNRVERLRVGDVRRELEGSGFRIAHAGRYGMYYTHHAGIPARLLSRRVPLSGAKAAVRSFNRLAGRIGNKLTVQAMRRRPHVQLWSIYYDPVPTGIGPIATMWARELTKRGYAVEVVSSHPHYPEPRWGRRALPYRETRDGIPVLRLPLWTGRETGGARIRQELTFALSHLAALPALGRPDAMVVISPSFPALLPAMMNARARRLPWLLWIQDILPDGAVATGYLEDGPALRASRRLERAAYESADEIVVLSQPFVDNLRGKGVPAEKLRLIHNPATRGVRKRAPADRLTNPRVLSMGNIGRTQGLPPLAAAFEASEAMRRRNATLAVAGAGVAADEVRAAITGDRVEMLGLLPDDRLETELQIATLALVSQHYEGEEFNLPSKLMNFMGYGIPVIAAVNPDSEVARIVREAEAGWVVDSSQPEAFPRQVEEALDSPDQLEARGAAGHDYAARHFSKERFVDGFDESLRRLIGGR